MDIRHDWTRDEIRGIYHLPLPELIFRAQTAHRAFHKADEVQLCRLAFDQDGRMPRGLRLLLAERALQDGRGARGVDESG